MSHDDYYAPTAYDSTKPRELPPRTPHNQLTLSARVQRGNDGTLAWGIYFGDFRNTNTGGEIKELKTLDGDTFKPELTAPISAETMEQVTLSNPKAAWAMVRGVAGLFCIVVGAMEVLRISSWGLSHVVERSLNDPLSLLIPGVPLSFFILGSIAVRLVDNKNNIIFNRRTGRVSVPRQRIGLKAYPQEEIPFDEFDGYLRMGLDGKSGGVFWRLTIGHRVSSRGFDLFDTFYKPAYGYQMWEFVQQFMDISKPLPEVAHLEPVRHLDPVTREYDRKTGRPPHYWRDRDPDDVAREAYRVRTVVEKFFWESLPKGNDPYIQEASVLAWRSYYPEHAAVPDSLKTKGWWPGMEREAQVIPFPQA